MAFSYTTVSLAGVPPFFVATDESLSDPYTTLIRTNFGLDDGLKLSLGLLRRRGTFVDLGANIGYYTLPLAARGVRTLAVEALPQNYSTLLLSLIKNGFTKVTPVHAAVWGSTGVLQVTGSSAWGQVLLTGAGSPVPCLRLEDLCRAYGFPEPDLIKIDIEGAELAVVEGAKGFLQPKRCPQIIFEANAWADINFKYRVESLLEAFESLGYSLYTIWQGLLVPHTSKDLQLRVCADYLAVAKARLPRVRGFTVRPLEPVEAAAILATDARAPEQEFRAYVRANANRIPARYLEVPLLRDALEALMADPAVQLVQYTALYNSV
jgi:FkbM family methyltransferase